MLIDPHFLNMQIKCLYSITEYLKKVVSYSYIAFQVWVVRITEGFFFMFSVLYKLKVVWTLSRLYETEKFPYG